MSEHNGSRGFPPRTMARNVSDLTHDAIALAELQAELFKVEVGDCLKRLMTPLILLIAATIIALGCVPIGLTAFAHGLVKAGLSTWLAFLLAAVAGLALAGVAGGLGWKLLCRSPMFSRSKAEFASNLSWVKRVLKSSTQKSI